MNKVVCVGGPHDGQVKETDQPLSPMVPIKLPIFLENGLLKNYNVVFITGEKIQFPIAVWEDLSPDDIFKMLLSWYSMKPYVKRVKSDEPIS